MSVNLMFHKLIEFLCLFCGQVVVLIGSAASAVDISREIATVAKEVHIAARSVEDDKLGKVPGHDNLWLHSMVKLIIHGENWMFCGYNEYP